MFGLKPELRAIDIESLKPEHLEYFCKTSFIDEMIMKKQNLTFNKELADEIEATTEISVYFVVRSDRTYDIVFGILFEPWLKKHGIDKRPLGARAKTCIEHYIKQLGY